MVSAGRRAYSMAEGNRAADKFVAACEQKGYTCEKTPRKVDIEEHIDYYVHRGSRSTVGVDVKGGNHPKTIWIEFKNVRGEKGSLQGKADFMAFELAEAGGFIMVLRKELLSWAEENVKKTFVGKKEATRKLYTREGREDVISRIWWSDLQQLPSYSVIPYAV